MCLLPRGICSSKKPALPLSAFDSFLTGVWSLGTTATFASNSTSCIPVAFFTDKPQGEVGFDGVAPSTSRPSALFPGTDWISPTMVKGREFSLSNSEGDLIYHSAKAGHAGLCRDPFFPPTAVTLEWDLRNGPCPGSVAILELLRVSPSFQTYPTLCILSALL